MSINFNINKSESSHSNFEHEALSAQFNLADAHPHLSRSEFQEEIIRKLPELWRNESHLTQDELEFQVIDNFFKLAGRNPLRHAFSPIITPSALTSINIISTLFAAQKSVVNLMHPTFYKLYDVLKNHGIKANAISEVQVNKIIRGDFKYLDSHIGEMLFLVDTNNPTGFSISSMYGKKGYENLVKFTTERKITLVLDLCFNWFRERSKDTEFDIYEIFKEHRASFVCLENYGKLIPIEETKVSFVVASDDLKNELSKIVEGFFLNPSPFIIRLGIEFLKDLLNDGLNHDYQLLYQNRQNAAVLLKNTYLKPLLPEIPSSVIWIEITNPEISADDFAEYCKSRGLYFIPGSHYFWESPELGRHFIRLACMRDPDYFLSSLSLLVKLCEEFLRL